MPNKFNKKMYVTAYQLARDGMLDAQIADAVGVTKTTFYRWRDKDKTLQDALDRGRHMQQAGDHLTFHQYVFDRLPEHLKEVWRGIDECATLENGEEKLEALLRDKGKAARQHLFLYSLTQSRFNVSESLRKLGMPRNTFENWKQDPDFLALLDEIQWHKENFFENAFIELVDGGNTLAVIHGVKTQCRSRGYNDKIEVEHSGTVTNEHSVDILSLDLPVAVRRTVLEALRAKLAEAEVTPQ